MDVKEFIKEAFREIQPDLVAEITRSVSRSLRPVVPDNKSKMVTRTEVVAAIGRTMYERAVRLGELKPIKNKAARNSKISFLRSDYNSFLEKMSQ